MRAIMAQCSVYVMALVAILSAPIDVIAENPKIHVFMHVCTRAGWKSIVERQLLRIQTSGLYEACDSISLGVLGDESIAPLVQKYPKINVLFQDARVGLCEYPTLYYLHHMCTLYPDDLVLYVHTKGVNHPGSIYAEDWAKLMEYFNIDRWRDCVSALTEEGYDICGVNWSLDPSPHFSGNFWWATGRYISIMGHYEYTGDRMLDELWIGKGSPKVKCFHTADVNHYYSRYPESKYKIED